MTDYVRLVPKGGKHTAVSAIAESWLNQQTPDEMLDALIADAVAAERESCAKVAEEAVVKWGIAWGTDEDKYAQDVVREQIATAIRARGE